MDLRYADEVRGIVTPLSLTKKRCMCKSNKQRDGCRWIDDAAKAAPCARLSEFWESDKSRYVLIDVFLCRSQHIHTYSRIYGAWLRNYLDTTYIVTVTCAV
jgi:hypothetical protein